ncbi:hypothetical protein Pcinc_040973 [Petrolisthes cinctipes]|uniref:Uncharacterized protein n=1 Tax=Petrolisthes cinctipes TaxID=88211 RepID=A0AAE1BNK1_PETCI|nr:hypothetical protein Pcinc_040973 [Petrolisthes cinctipes]
MPCPAPQPPETTPITNQLRPIPRLPTHRPHTHSLIQRQSSFCRPHAESRFTAGNVVIITGNLVVDKWVREKVVNGVDLSITPLGYAFFLVSTVTPGEIV